uniref:Arginine--tRNA ligase, chloroplastic/mitochondrial n=1 Tax=Tanacetum cinerariifolium TaxID=118510 RepID=A0A699GUP2_TANCI|nr:arginine--tRNA ligase, chloroplastic/mitochondrial [Tanacetum cinerariifolium]
MEEEIAKEVQVEYLIHALKEISQVIQLEYLQLPKDLSRRCRRRHKRKVANDLARHTWRLKRELAKLIILKQESERDDKRWSIQLEVANLFEVSLRLSYPEFKDEKSIFLPCAEEEYGDYQCENVMSISHQLREEGTMPLGPRRIGWKIKRNLQLLRPQMIEREPWVCDIGFVTIKLSGKWMAKSIHKMLRDGIDTWAPKLLLKSVLVNFPSCDMADLTQMDLLRRELIKTTSMRMLEYCKIDAEFMMPCEMALPQEQLDKFRIEKRDDGDVLIFRNGEEEREPLIHAKRDGWSGDPEKDLADLWYGLKTKTACWIVCVTPVQQQEYIKMCFKAAQHATWLPRDWWVPPQASFTGYQTYNTELKHEDLDLLLEKAKMSCSAAAKELGYTGEQVSNCVLKYTILKNSRLTDFTFNYEEMLNAEGNTFVYLLNTQFRIRSFMEGSREDIDKLKKDPELTLEKGEIWKEGVERELVRHLFEFTEVGFVAETPKLLLCEATAVVMEKGFQLLGIIPESSFLGEEWPQVSSLGLTKSRIQVERLNRKDPPKVVNTRIELLSVCPHITRDPSFRRGKIFGYISVSDTYNLRSDGWGKISLPDHGYVTLFDCDWPDPVDITNRRPVRLGNPKSSKLVPFSSFMEFCYEIYASTETNDAFFQVCHGKVDTNFKDFLEGDDDDTTCSVGTCSGWDGHLRMNYVLLKDPMDSNIKVTYVSHKDEGGKEEVFADIFAYYGRGFFDKTDPFIKDYYTASLFRSCFDTKITGIPLTRSMLAVPTKGSIVIVAHLSDVDSGVTILTGDCEFLAGCGGEQKIDAPCGTLHVSVDWSRC